MARWSQGVFILGNPWSKGFMCHKNRVHVFKIGKNGGGLEKMKISSTKWGNFSNKKFDHFVEQPSPRP